MKKILLLCTVTMLFGAMTFAQQPVATPPEDQVVRIATDLIRIDVTVTDKNGKLVGVIAQADIAMTSEIPKGEVADVLKSVRD